MFILSKATVILYILSVGIFNEAFGQDSIDTSMFVKGHPGIYAILIAKNNKLIKSTYYNDFTTDSLFNDQSLTKGICSLLIGIAIEHLFIKSVDEKLSTFFPELKNDQDKRKGDITLHQVMNQASGLYHEDLNRMDIYLSNPNPSRLVIRSPLSNDPGKEWHYNNAASHLLSVIITRATGMDTKTFAAKYLFTPLGITRFEWPKMRDGYYDGGGLLAIRLRAQDLLKIGLLMSNKGMYDSKQVVPAAWIEQLINPAIKYNATWGFKNSEYALCWYHAQYKGIKFTYGMGWGGQFIILIPAFNAVIVINENSADRNAIKQSNNFTTNIFPMIYEQLKS